MDKPEVNERGRKKNEEVILPNFIRCRSVFSLFILQFSFRQVAAAFLLAALSLRAQGVQHLSITQPGGMPGMPVMTGIRHTTNGVRISWDGPAGAYQIWRKSPLTGAAWQAVGGPTNLDRTATITALYRDDFFRVSGPAPQYAGAQTCAECHGNIHASWMLTAHAGAFTNAQFVAEGGQTNASCWACHTVGYGLPTGFVSASQTPLLEGVQCENCHGPAAYHAADPGDFAAIPRVEVAAQLCGGCHSARLAPASVAASHPSFFEDWDASPHHAVVPEALAVMSASTKNISRCGRCHSGSARLALLGGRNPSATLTNDFDVAITCVVCHDPHARHVWTNVLSGAVYTKQLRNPLSSTNDYVLTTSDVFTNTYDPDINVCAQCHNDRGAAWRTIATNSVVTNIAAVLQTNLVITTNYFAPHHSPQYNMLLGTVGELTGGPATYHPAAHALLIENQCAGCHLQAATNDASGHAFEVATYQVCSKCHTDPAGLVQFVTGDISNQIEQAKTLLDLWGRTRAPAALQTNDVVPWEYTAAGDLSPGKSGPDAAGQALIPDDIKKARFDLYLVLYDGSYGVHNGPYDVELLQAAQDWVEGELYK